MSESGRLISIAGLIVKRAGEERPRLDGISIAVDRGETVVVLGEAGSGADALMRALNRSLDDDESVAGTIRYDAVDAVAKAVPSVRTTYLPGPASQPLSPHAPVSSQFARIIARRLHAPYPSGRAEFEQELGRLEGAPAHSAFDRRASETTPEILAWGLLAAALAQAPSLLLLDHFFEGLAPKHARALEKALLAAKARLHCTLLCATMSTETAVRLGGRLIVLRQGRIVEEGPVARLRTSQAHAYTRTLFKNPEPRERGAARGQSVLQVQHVRLGSHASDEVNFELRLGASLALMGDKGSGRHALARLILGLDKLQHGRIVFDAVDIGILSGEMMSRLRRRVAIVAGADDVLDPRMSLWETVAEPLRAHLHLSHDLVAKYCDSALRRVGLASLSGRLPISALSVFDKRRLQVARAIVTAPVLAIIDEPFQGLDAFAKSVIRDLLQNFRFEEGPAFLVITSDFAVARMLAEEAMVFRERRIVERGQLAEMLRTPKNSYTRSLAEASYLNPSNPLSPVAGEV